MNYSDYELIYMVKESEDALTLMMKKYEPLFKKLSFSFAKKYKHKGIDPEDLVQQCRIALCYALERYDIDNETKFYSYLLVCIRRAINNYTRSVINHPDIYYYMENEYEFYSSISDNIDIYDSILEDDITKFFRNFILGLDFMDACIFELRFNNFSYKEIAKLLEISVKRVDNVLLKIRKKFEKLLYYEY